MGLSSLFPVNVLCARIFEIHFYRCPRHNRGMVNVMKISARNQIPGTVKSIKKGPVSTEVVITIAGGNEIVSTITTHSAENLKLREGSKVYAIVKASEVMVGVD